MYYAIVTFGPRGVKTSTYYRSLARAERDAQAVRARGLASAIRIYECTTRQLAATADISVVRRGERIVDHIL